MRPNLQGAVAALNYQRVADGMDVEAVGAPQAAFIPVVGGISTLMTYLKALVIRGFHEPFEEFKNQITCNEEATRIRKAMLPSQIDTAANRIAEVVAADRPVTAPVLRAVVREATTRDLTDLERQVQSLMAQVANLSGHQGVPFRNQAPTQAQGRGRGRGGRGGAGGRGRG